MRTYIIGNDGIALCRKAPTTVSEGEIVVASKRYSRRHPGYRLGRRRKNCTRRRSAASGFWHCGTRCPVSIRGERLATARG